MTERNPTPPQLSHLDQLRPKPTSKNAMGGLINDLRTYAKALSDGDNESRGIIAEDAAEAMVRAADYLDVLRRSEPVTQFRGIHAEMFRSGEWGALLGVVIANGRPCFRVRYADGVEDDTPIVNEDFVGTGGLGVFYEIRGETRSSD